VVARFSRFGRGVHPTIDVFEERDPIRLQAEKKGPAGMHDCRRRKNSLSIDGLPGLERPHVSRTVDARTAHPEASGVRRLV
jgi:hypothetical protein